MARLVGGKKKASTLKEWLTWQVRRLSYRWPPRSECLRAAQSTRREFEKHPGVEAQKVSTRVRLFFKCAGCGYLFPRREVSVDHIMPVVDPTVGWVSWDEYLRRLFCAREGFQVLCNTCHDHKTKKELQTRLVQRRKERYQYGGRRRRWV